MVSSSFHLIKDKSPDFLRHLFNWIAFADSNLLLCVRTTCSSIGPVWTLKKDFIWSNQRRETDEQRHSDTAAEEKQTRSHFKEPWDAFKIHTGNKLQQKFIAFHDMKGLLKVTSPQVVPSLCPDSTPKQSSYQWRAGARLSGCLHGRCYHGSGQIIYISKTQGNTLLFNVRKEERDGYFKTTLLQNHCKSWIKFLWTKG